MVLKVDLLSVSARRCALIAALILSVHLLSYAYIGGLAARNPEAAAYPLLKGDSGMYAELADSLIVAGGFAGSEFETERHWPPGYAAYLAVTKWVSGSFHLAVVLQILAVLGAVFLIYKMALRFLTPLWATVPALLYGLDPSVVLANTVILSDSIFASLMIGIIYFAFFTEVRHEWLRWGSVGLMLAVATLVRPIAQFLIVLAPLFLALHLYWRGNKNIRTYLVSFVVYSVLAVSVLAPWLTWVHARHGVYEISHVGASNLLHYNVQDFLAWQAMNEEGRSVPAILSTRYQDDSAYDYVRAELDERLQALAPSGADTVNYEGTLAVSYILNDPLHYAYFHLVNTAPFFLGSSIAAYVQVVVQVRDSTGYFAPTALALIESLHAIREGNMAEFMRVAPIALEILAWASTCVLAAVALWHGRRDLLILIFAALIVYFAVLTGPVSIARYRIPAEPYLLILAVIGARIMYDRLRHRVWR